jgi:hypothetical protein
MYRPARLELVVIVRDIQPVVDKREITALDQTLSEREDPVFLYVSHSKGVIFLGDVRSLEHSANLGAVAYCAGPDLVRTRRSRLFICQSFQRCNLSRRCTQS